MIRRGLILSTVLFGLSCSNDRVVASPSPPSPTPNPSTEPAPGTGTDVKKPEKQTTNDDGSTTFVADAGEDVYRVRVSATRVVWSSGRNGDLISARPFDGGATSVVTKPFQAAGNFDIEGETLTIVTSPSGIYQYDVRTGKQLKSVTNLPAGGIGPIAFHAGNIYYPGNIDDWSENGPNLRPLVSAPVETWQYGDDLAVDVKEVELANILATDDAVYFAGHSGVYRVDAEAKTADLIVPSKDARSLATDGEFLYWVEDAGSVQGSRALMRSKLDGSKAEAVGPTKVLAVAAIPGRLFYSAEERQADEGSTIACSLRVLSTKD